MKYFLLSFLCGCATETVTFTEVYDDVFSLSCAFSSCHAVDSNSPDLSSQEAAQASLINVESEGKPGAFLVLPADADNSYLIQKLEGASGIDGDAMPPTGSLPAEEIERLRSWIDAGAIVD